jgi:putative oxidoreductase
MDWVLLLGRILYGVLFISSGAFFHLKGRDMAVEYSRMKGAPMPELTVPLTGIVIILAGAMIIVGLWMDLAALAIFVFLLLTVYYIHAFWKVEDPQERMQEQVHFQKDLALAGAALILFYLAQQFGDAVGISIEPALFD